MIRGLSAAVRSIAFPIGLCRRSRSADAISHRALARCFNSFSRQYPYYGEPVGRYQDETIQRHYADRAGYQLDHNFGQFHPGVSARDSRFGQFRGEYGPDPGRFSWREYGPECYCRCCGRPFWGYNQQYVPVNYGVGNYRAGGVYETGYDHGGGYQMRSGYSRNHAGGGFDGSDGRSLGYANLNKSYGGNSGYYPSNVNGSVRQHGRNSGDGYYDRRGVPQEKWSEEQRVAHDRYSYRQPQDGGRDGRDRNAWSDSRNNYNQYGPEHSVYGESNEFHQRNGYVEQKNSHTGDQTRVECDGRSVSGQPQDATVNGQPMNSDGADGEFQHTRQSPHVSDVLRNEFLHGSRDRNQNVHLQTGSNYNQAGVSGNYGHQNLNRPYNENLNGFRQNSNMSHGQNMNVPPNGDQNQKRFDAADIGEPGRIFQDKQVVKQDSVNVRYEQTRDGSNLRNPHRLFPEFTATDRPLKRNVTSDEKNQMPNIDDSRNDGGSLPRTMVHVDGDVSNGSNKAAHRCQRIIDVLETEDKHGPKVPGNRFVSQSRNEYAN